MTLRFDCPDQQCCSSTPGSTAPAHVQLYRPGCGGRTRHFELEVQGSSVQKLSPSFIYEFPRIHLMSTCVCVLKRFKCRSVLQALDRPASKFRWQHVGLITLKVAATLQGRREGDLTTQKCGCNLYVVFSYCEQSDRMIAARKLISQRFVSKQYCSEPSKCHWKNEQQHRHHGMGRCCSS